jgi:hypothetical protein
MHPSFDLVCFTQEKTTNEMTSHQPGDGDTIIHDLTKPDLNTMTTAPQPAGLTTPYSPYTENVIYSECALAAKWDLSPKFLNLNAKSLAAEYSDSPVAKRKLKPGKLARSPWAMGVKHPVRDQELTSSLYAWIETTESPELGRYVIFLQYFTNFCASYTILETFFSLAAG